MQTDGMHIVLRIAGDSGDIAEGDYPGVGLSLSREPKEAAKCLEMD